MILCLDIGNTQIYGGVFVDEKLKFQFRKSSKPAATSDELGLFLTNVLKENGFNSKDVKNIAFCSVVPDIIYSLRNCCNRYFKVNPFSVGPGVKSGLKIKYRNPLEVGPDRIANAIAATHRYPDKNLIIVDFGTATTFCAINTSKEYLGGAIIPGMKISMQSLENNTARLPSVEIINSKTACGRSTVESIQSGLFYGNIGMIKELTKRMKTECFNDKDVFIIGTGGFTRLFANSELFDVVIPDLVLSGIFQSLKMNS